MATCPICASPDVAPVVDLGEVPLFCNVQWPTREQAMQAKKAPLALCGCSACGHVFNDRFDAELMAYSPGYDNTQHFSSTFRSYAEKLVARLIERHGIRGSAVVDIGCGRGDLLQLLAQRGGNRGYGFDPSFAAATVEETPSVTISREYFGREQALAIGPALVCCRHVLEHVPNAVEFLSTLRDAITARGSPVLYLEVPNGEHLLRTAGLWDYIYEHVSYFSKRSLELAFQRAGYEILDLFDDFGGQFLCVEARPLTARAASAAKVQSPLVDLATAAAGLNAKLEHWRRWTQDLRGAAGRATVWGTGSKGVMFLNLLQLQAPSPIEFAVDQNPNKHGRFVSCTGQRVAGPQSVVDERIEQVVLMNEIYLGEVQDQLGKLGARARVLTA